MPRNKLSSEKVRWVPYAGEVCQPVLFYFVALLGRGEIFPTRNRPNPGSFLRPRLQPSSQPNRIFLALHRLLEDADLASWRRRHSHHRGVAGIRPTQPGEFRHHLAAGRQTLEKRYLRPQHSTGEHIGVTSCDRVARGSTLTCEGAHGPWAGCVSDNHPQPAIAHVDHASPCWLLLLSFRFQARQTSARP